MNDVYVLLLYEGYCKLCNRLPNFVGTPYTFHLIHSVFYGKPLPLLSLFFLKAISTRSTDIAIAKGEFSYLIANSTPKLNELYHFYPFDLEQVATPTPNI